MNTLAQILRAAAIRAGDEDAYDATTAEQCFAFRVLALQLERLAQDVDAINEEAEGWKGRLRPEHDLYATVLRQRRVQE